MIDTLSWMQSYTEGLIIAYFKGKESLSRLLPKLKFSLKVLTLSEIKNIVKNIAQDPIYLPSLSKENKERKARELLSALDNIR